MAGKQLELLKKVIPSLRRVGALWNPSNPGHAPVLEKLNASARRLELKLQLLEVRGPDDFEVANRLQGEYCGPFVKPPFLDIPFHMTGPTR